MSENLLKYPVCGAGRIWGQNEAVPDSVAAKMDREHFAEVSETIDDAAGESDDAGDGGGDGGEGDSLEEWYDSSTVATVLDGVGEDPVRAQFAIARELERAKPRDGVLNPLTALIGG